MIELYFIINGCIYDSDFNYRYSYDWPLPFKCLSLDSIQEFDLPFPMWLRLE